MVKILDYYQKHESEGKLRFEYDKDHPKKPIWIKILNRPKGVHFLNVQTSEYPEIIYRAFGNYFHPVDQTPEEGKRFMAAIARDYDAMVSKNNIPMAEHLVGKLKDLGLPKDVPIIDLGAGTGIASSVLSKRGYENLTLFDYSEEMLAIAKLKPELDAAKFIVGDVTKDLPPQKFDLIISVMLFDYLDNETLKETLKKWTDQLEDGGILAIVEDADRSPYKSLFDVIGEGKIKVGGMEKYYFIGRKKQ